TGEWPCLSFWSENWLLAPHDSRGQPFAPSALLERMPDQTLACLRYLQQQGLDMSNMLWCPERDDPLSLEDLAVLLGAYGKAVLEPQAPEVWQRLKTALAQLGYRFQQGRFRLRQGEIDKILALSAAKL